MKRILHTFSIWLLSVSLAAAQTGVGQIANGHLLANASGRTAVAGDTAATSWFDQAYCNTIGFTIVRFTGSWTCAKWIAANPVWWGADPTGAADSATAFNSALSATNNVQFPPGLFKFASAINYTITANAALKIACSGQDATTLFWNNTSGIIITYATPQANSFTISDCTLATQTAGVGSALRITSSSVGGPGGMTHIDRMSFRGADGYSQTDYWANDLVDINIGNVYVSFSEFVATGCTAIANVGTGITISATAAQSVFNVVSSNFSCLNNAFVYGTLFQGVNVHQTNMTSVNNGIIVPGGGAGLDQLTVTGSQIACYTTCINMASVVTAAMIVGNLITSSGGGVAVGAVVGTFFGTIVGNTVACADTGSNGVSIFGDTWAVTGNIFAGCATGLILQSGSSKVNTQGNTFAANTTPLVNSGTGHVIANNLGYNPVGYTAGTSTGTSAAVLTAGPSPETHYITQSANFNAVVAKCTLLACGTSTNLCTVPSATAPCVIDLGPNESYKVTWSTTQPTYTKDIH